jgi:thiol-disulfide isomerase/thioredoxin
MKNENAIIYFGANWCPWCRNAIGVLLESAKKYRVDTIYYVDMDKVRNVWKVKNGKLIKTQKEGKGYYKLLDALDEVLEKDTYKVTDSDNNEYDTKEKRIYMPFVVEVKNGNIVDAHTGTVELNENQTKYDKLTSSQHKELLKIYDNYMDDVTTSGKCEEDTTGCD